MANLRSELQPAWNNPSRWQASSEQEERITKPALRAHPIAELVPDMTPDQYGALRDDIREHGLRTPTVMYEGMVLDGRNRARAWYDVHGNWDVPSTDFKGTPEEAIAYVRSHNIKRRHLKPSQIAYYEAQAAAFWKAQPGRPKKKFCNSATQRQIAKEAGVHIETIALAAKAVKAAPEVGPYLRDGKISVNRALKVANCPTQSASMRSPSHRSANWPSASRSQLRNNSPMPMPMQWLARGSEACVRLAKEKGSYALATKMRALKDQARTPYDLAQALLAHSPAPPRALPEE